LLTQIENPPRTLRSRHTRLATRSLLLICLLGLFTTGVLPGTAELEIFPEHFVLQPGEQIHYTVCSEGSKPRCPDAKFAIKNPKIVRLIDPKGIVEALTPGRTQLVVRTATSERRVTIKVAGPGQPPMPAVHHSTLTEIVAKEFLFVGHANLDGFDHTAVAKPGIDRLVQQAKKNGVPVVYWVSQEYPNWYTADRHPDYAFISEGQEDWTIVVRFGDRFERVYRRGDSKKTLLIEFQGV